MVLYFFGLILKNPSKTMSQILCISFAWKESVVHYGALQVVFSDFPKNAETINSKFNKWKKQWAHRTIFTDNRIKALKLMKTQNPLVIPRNHLVESVLENAIQGSRRQFNELLNLLSKPYDYKSNHNNFQTIPVGFDDCYTTYCGT